MNFESGLEMGIREVARILKPEGHFVISMRPQNFEMILNGFQDDQMIIWGSNAFGLISESFGISARKFKRRRFIAIIILA